MLVGFCSYAGNTLIFDVSSSICGQNGNTFLGLDYWFSKNLSSNQNLEETKVSGLDRFYCV